LEVIDVNTWKKSGGKGDQQDSVDYILLHQKKNLFQQSDCIQEQKSMLFKYYSFLIVKTGFSLPDFLQCQE